MAAGCRLCGQEAKQRCSGCFLVFYCSKEHQRLDWKKHKPDCLPFEVVSDAAVGRCLVARRPIPAGEVVLRERPVVSGPAQITGPVCLGCHQGLGAGPGVACPRCGWPLCSSVCANLLTHWPECDWTVSKRKEKVRISNFSNPHPTYACVMALRILHAKTTDPKLWAKISSLETHEAARRKDGRYEQDRFAVAKLLRRFYKLEDEVSEEEILQICGIIQINGHEVPLSEPPHVAIYWRCSLMEHSCRPNCSKSFSENGSVVVRAALDIKPGEHLSICYSDPLWGTPARLEHLQGSKYFQCSCPRCKDPTEYSTFFSALLCLNRDCKGRILPATFMEPGAPWTCDQCPLSASTQQVAEVLMRAGERMLVVDKTSPKSCQHFLQEDLGLSENHFHRTEVKVSLAQLIGQTCGGMSQVGEHWLQLKEQLCRQLIALSAVLFPAECRLRGVLFFELHATVAERARRCAAKGDSVADLLMDTRKHLEEAVGQLREEPGVMPEGRICKQARENLRDLDRLLQSMAVPLPGSL